MSEAAIIAQLLREEREARLEAERELERTKWELAQLQAQAQPSSSADHNPDHWITVAQAAQEMHLSPATIYRAIKDGSLAGAKRVRGALRIHRPTLLESGLSKPGVSGIYRTRKQRC